MEVGGFYRLDAGNGHAAGSAIVADLDKDGTNEIYVDNATGDLVNLDARTRSSKLVWHASTAQDPIAVDGSLLLRSCENQGRAVCRYSPGGDLLWYTTLPYVLGQIPIGPNIGKFGPQGKPGIVIAGAPQYPMTTYAVSLDGELLWQASDGPYWDATYAIADFNHDGIDDVVYNYNTAKAHVINGIDGTLLARPVTLPRYRQFDYVDYNGAPIVVTGADQALYVLDVEDNGHLALMRPLIDDPDPRSVIVWTVEQDSLDDERAQMPALAPAGNRSILGCGSKRGVFTARDVATGASLWQRTLIESVNPLGTALTKSIAVDVNGDGSADFVVGGDDGVVHALDAATGRVLWAIDLGSPIGELIVADVDGDGFSEIVVSAADGWLYEISERVRRRLVSH
jgi:outer membrane protein assembly factor BamB